MAYYGMTNEYVKATNAANKVKKDIERQEILKEETRIADNKMGINGVLLKRNFGEPLFFVEGTSCNLWVYEDKVILDRSRGGILNVLNHTVKIIPIKNILTVQFKNDGAPVAYIEFGVAGSDANQIQNVDIGNENLFMFTSNKSTAAAIDAYFYIANKICK